VPERFLGENLKRILGLHALTAKDASTVLGLSVQALSELQKGKRTSPSLRTVGTIAGFFDIPIGHLLDMPTAELVATSLSDPERYIKVERELDLILNRASSAPLDASEQHASDDRRLQMKRFWLYSNLRFLEIDDDDLERIRTTAGDRSSDSSNLAEFAPPFLAQDSGRVRGIPQIVVFVDTPTAAANMWATALEARTRLADGGAVVDLSFCKLLFKSAGEQGTEGKFHVGSSTIVYLAVDDFEATLERLIVAGCELWRGPIELDGMRRTCEVRDPFGNVWGLNGP
jgi:transcriptional regulator with XRE-family HTH domain